MTRPSSHFLVRFDPAAAPPTPSTPEDALRLSLVTELRGARTRVDADGSRLAAALSIAFAPWLSAMCDRVSAGALVPATLPNLVIGAVAYNGSRCVGLPARLIEVRGGSSPDWSLALNFPSQNLYPLFSPWPEIGVIFDPPLEPDATPPASRTRLISLGHDNVNDHGVRIPMRLIIDRGSLGTIELATLNRDDSPELTGGGTRITGPQPFWTLTRADIEAKIAGLDPGLYPVTLVIYEGDGRMDFALECLRPPNDDTATEATWTVVGERAAVQGGDFGVFEACRVSVATLLITPAAEFHYTVGAARYALSSAGVSSVTPMSFGSRYWYRSSPSERLVTWSGNRIYYGFLTLIISGFIAAAGVDAQDRLVYVIDDGEGWLIVRRRDMASGEDHLLGEGRPERWDYGMAVELSPNADALLYIVQSRAPLESNGRVMWAPIPTGEAPESLVWTTLSDEALWQGNDITFYTTEQGDGPVYAGLDSDWRIEGVYGAWFDAENNPVISRYTLESHYETRVGGVQQTTVTLTIPELGATTLIDSTYKQGWPRETSVATVSAHRAFLVGNGSPNRTGVAIGPDESFEAFLPSPPPATFMVYDRGVLVCPGVTAISQLLVAVNQDADVIEVAKWINKLADDAAWTTAGLFGRQYTNNPPTEPLPTWVLLYWLLPGIWVSGNTVLAAHGNGTCAQFCGSHGRYFYQGATLLPDPGAIVGLVPALLACPLEIDYPPIPDIDVGGLPNAFALLQAHNLERVAHGRGALQWSDTLEAAARAHAEWMEANDTLSHTGDGDSTPLDRARAAGFTGVDVGENIAAGFTNNPEVMMGWMASPPHRANILHPAFTVMGAYTAPSARWTQLWVVVFGG